MRCVRYHCATTAALNIDVVVVDKGGVGNADHGDENVGGGGDADAMILSIQRLLQEFLCSN